VLYESGCRIGELMMLRIKHISFDEFGALILVDGKTGPRRVRLISSVPYLNDWLRNYPGEYSRDSFLWVGSTGNLIRYSRASYIIRNLARKAGIRKSIHPHLFRHSRATFLANHLTEAQMKEMFGWTRDSDMAGVYVHLSGRDVDHALLRVNGVSRPEARKENALKPIVCEQCQEQNLYTNKICSRCGNILDDAIRHRTGKNRKDREKADKIMDMLVKDPEFREFFIRKLQGLGTAQGD
jgi:integrase/recombinase XerD